MSRETVAWVTAKPCALSASTTSRWLPIGRVATSSRIAALALGLRSWPSSLRPLVRPACGARRAGRHAAPAGAARLAVMRVPNVGSVRARLEGLGGGRVGDDRLGAVPAERPERGPDLGHHPAGDDTGFDEGLGLARR